MHIAQKENEYYFIYRKFVCGIAIITNWCLFRSSDSFALQSNAFAKKKRLLLFSSKI